MTLSAGKIQFMLNQPAEAAKILKLGVRDDLTDLTNREIARWYLVALIKNGDNDQALYDKLLQIDPTEGRSIEILIEQTF
ncbi:hypothetical protein D3C77_766650 [compost metagenome]